MVAEILLGHTYNIFAISFPACVW